MIQKGRSMRMHAKARAIMEKRVTIRIKLWDEKMNFFT